MPTLLEAKSAVEGVAAEPLLAILLSAIVVDACFASALALLIVASEAVGVVVRHLWCY